MTQINKCMENHLMWTQINGCMEITMGNVITQAMGTQRLIFFL